LIYTKKIKEIDNNVKICFLTASEMYYETFRNTEYSSIDNHLFIHKPIENGKLIKKINKIINNKEIVFDKYYNSETSTIP